jgi:hypothetical protein
MLLGCLTNLKYEFTVSTRGDANKVSSIRQQLGSASLTFKAGADLLFDGAVSHGERTFISGCGRLSS